MSEKKEKTDFTTGLVGLDKLLLGGIKRGKPYVLFGQPKAGKTWLSYQIAIEAILSGHRVLYIDTESFWEDEVEALYRGYYQKRFPTLTNDTMKKLTIWQPLDLFELGTMFGMDILLIQNENSMSAQVKYPKRETTEAATEGEAKKAVPPKTSEQWRDWYERSPVYKELDKGEYDMLILDSLTAPIKEKIPFARQNIPAARNPVQNPFLSFFRTVSHKMNIPCIFTAHTVADQTNQGDYGHPWGGNDVTYFIKRQIGLLHITSAEWNATFKKYRPFDMYRRFYRARYPGLMPEMAYGLLEKDTGFIEIPDPTKGPG